MSRGPVYFSDEAHASNAAKIMEEKKSRRLMVRDARGKVTGIVSLGDLTRILSKDKMGKLIREVSRPVPPGRIADEERIIPGFVEGRVL
jgi:CBS domain-containing protein